MFHLHLTRSSEVPAHLHPQQNMFRGSLSFHHFPLVKCVLNHCIKLNSKNQIFQPISEHQARITPPSLTSSLTTRGKPAWSSVLCIETVESWVILAMKHLNDCLQETWLRSGRSSCSQQKSRQCSLHNFYTSSSQTE